VIDSASIVTFRVAGTELENEEASQFLAEVLPESEVESAHIYSVHSDRSGALPVLTKAVEGLDVVVVKIASGPALLLHPETAKALLTSGKVILKDAFSDSVAVPVTATLPWSDGIAVERNGTPSLQGAVLQWFGVVRLVEIAARQTALAAAKHLDKQVREGLYQLRRELLPKNLGLAGQTPDPWSDDYADKTLLVLIHGTFVNTASTFGKLWTDHPGIVDELFKQYDGRVFAFDHATVAKSPIANALALAGALPIGAEVHFLTHSRGGLIAEILVRASKAHLNEDDLKPFSTVADASDDELAQLAEQRAQLMEIQKTLLDNKISIKRVVRVACPARGTLLASSRLDAYLSVIQWLMRSAGLQIAPLLLSFLREVARQGIKPNVLPGIAAMVPGSPLVQWLNSPVKEVASSLYVIAGDSGNNSVTTWLKTLVADDFYWGDNDLVVQTRSMYGGVPRDAESDGAHFVLLEGGEISHFSYFSFPDSAHAIADALRQAQIRKWLPIGPLSWRGDLSCGVRGRPVNDRAANTASRPCVFIIPDFFGSHLETSDRKSAWLSARALTEFSRLKVNESADSALPSLTATDLVAECYGNLCDRLKETHQVIDFPYDWRLPVEKEAKRLAETIARQLDEISGPAQPIRIIAHGMGGLLVRAMHMNDRKVWDSMMALDGARIVMMGTPNAGTWTPMQALSGDDSFGNVLNSTGPLFGDATIRDTMAGMPGFVQLQAGLLEPTLKLGIREGWEALENAQKKMQASASCWHVPSEAWAIPSQHLLTEATIFWRKLEQHLPDLARDMDKITLVIGAARTTPNEIVNAAGQLCFNSVGQGDGRVTLDSARLLNGRVWRIDAEHGQLPSAASGFSGLLDLLSDGTTTRLEKIEPLSGAEGHPASLQQATLRTQTRRFRQPSSAVPPGEVVDVFKLTRDEGFELPLNDRLVVKVYHGDLRFVRNPLLVGHYQSLSLSGSEAVVDKLVSSRMSKALRAGIYPERVGSYQIFENGRHINFERQQQRYIPRPKAAIVVGLGEEGTLKAQHLSFTIRTGIMAFAERLAENGEGDTTFEIAATLLGSGGTGITVSNAALSLVQAITDANAKLKEAEWPQVSALEIVEMYLDRATDAWRVLTMHAKANPDRLEVKDFLIEGNGNLRRPLDSSYRGASYDFISALEPEGSKDSQPVIAYSLDTKRARTEVRAQRTQGPLLRDLVAKASNSSKGDPLIGRTLFNLLVPVEIEPYLAESSDMVMELDDKTSTLPWELLDTEPDAKAYATSGPPPPWAIRCKVIRKLQVKQYRAQIADASVEDNVLIIGEPLVDEKYGRLPGAQREADAIYKVACATGIRKEQVTLLAERNDARTIINQLFARNYRLVHIAGHGTGGTGELNGGVVLSGAKTTFLGPHEIMAMRVTPELVFVNCCYLAQRENEHGYDRVSFAASVAQALINIGVRCVIAAGWAIEDLPAEKFATAFYAALFGGARFIDAVGQARRAAWEANRDGNSWAAYQCYGDPDWSWQSAATAAPPSPQEEYAGVAAPFTLILVLQSIAIETLYTSVEHVQRHRARLEHLEEKFKLWIERGDVAEEFGKAYAALPDPGKAIRWFDIATKAKDAGATLNALELSAEQRCLPGAAKDELEKAIKILRTLIKFTPTLRRQTLLGIALKRLSAATAKPSLLEVAWRAFKEAAKFKDDKYNFYPARAAIECELRNNMLTFPQHRLAANWSDNEIAEVGRQTEFAAHAEPNFWSIVAQSQLDLLKAVLRCRLQRVFPEIEDALKDLHNRISTPRFWIYVYDDARFLLEPYLKFAPACGDDAEVKAAENLLNLLKKNAGVLATD
jgi:hypothetical protein